MSYISVEIEQTSASQKKQKAPLIVGAALLGFLILLAGAILMLKTTDGTLIVTVDQPDVTIDVANDRGAVEIVRKTKNAPMTMMVVPGTHQLTVRKNGFELFKEQFELKPGKTVAMTARLYPLEKSVGQADRPRPGKAAAVEPPPHAAPETIPTAMTAIQGQWKCIAFFTGINRTSVNFEGDDRQITIKENLFTVTQSDRGLREILAGEFMIDETNRQFDFKGHYEQPPERIGELAAWTGFYHLDGDILKLCYRVNTDGAHPRPQSIDEQQPETHLEIFVRIH